MVSFRLLVCTFIHTYIFIMLTPSSHTITFACPPFSFGHRAREKERAPTSWHIFNFRLFFFIFLSLVYLLLFVFLYFKIFTRGNRTLNSIQTVLSVCVSLFFIQFYLFFYLMNVCMYVYMYIRKRVKSQWPTSFHTYITHYHRREF